MHINHEFRRKGLFFQFQIYSKISSETIKFVATRETSLIDPF